MMQFENTSYAGDVQILKRKPFEGVAITLTFGEGETVINAGSVIGDDGKVYEAGGSATVAGILLHDVAVERPQATILKKAYINTSVAEAHAKTTYTKAIKDALPMIVFE